jgi:photosystem II stability/assembly factor-like uncharacterized protein
VQSFIVLLITASISLTVPFARPGATTKGEVRQWEITGPWGGDVRSLVGSPDNPDLLYLGTSDGQIFRSTDGAESWRRLKPGPGKRGLSIDNIVIDPRNTNILYAGAWSVVPGEEGGVFKSEDAGQHWKLLDETKGLSVRSLAIAPSDSNLLIAGTANDDPKLNGAFRSTDAGKNWERITPEGDKEIRNIESVAIDPQNTGVIIVGTWHLPWKSTDGGKTWKKTGYPAAGMLDDSDIFGVCIDPVNPKLVYINACSGIYRSVNGGDKWEKLPGILFSARRTYALLPHPSDATAIFAGTSEGLWRSRDGGKKWMIRTSKTWVIRSIVVHPNKPNRVVIATDDNGIQISDNFGDDFRPANDGFTHRHILAIQPDLTERGRILASVFHDGSAGSVFLSTDGGDNWENSSRGLGTRDVYAFYQAPENLQIIYAGTNAGVYKSMDRGLNWSFVGIEKPPPPPKKRPAPRSKRAKRTRAGLSSFSRVGLYETVPAAQRSKPKRSTSKKKPSQRVVPPQPAGPVLIELTSQVDDLVSFTDVEGRHGLLAATMNGLYRTVDETKGWEQIDIQGYDFKAPVFSVSTHPKEEGVIFVGARSGLFISHDRGVSWSHIERGPTDKPVKAIARDPNDPNFIIIGTNQFVYRSTNGGRSWTVRGGGVPVGDFTSVCINPLNANEVMVADYRRGGVYRSGDKGYTWERIDTELPSSRVWTLTFDPFDRERVYAGSFSSGVYVLTIQRGADVSGK